MRLRATPEASAAAVAAGRIPAPTTQVIVVPADFILFKTKISRGNVITIPLPPVLTRADVEQLIAGLRACAVDDEPELLTLRSAKGEIERVLVEDLGDVVVVTRAEEYEAAKREGRNPIAIGFKRADIVSRRPYERPRP